MMAVSDIILVKEFERLSIGTRWDSQNRTVGPKEVAAIDIFQMQSGKELLKLGHRTIQSTNWVGTLGVGKHCLEVIPKIDDATGELDGRRTRENFLWMVARAGIVPIASGDVALLADPKRPLLAAFLQLYVDKLSREWQSGPIKVYVAEEQNRPFLKGKLLFQAHIRYNLIQQQRFYTVADEFTMDNAYSQLLKSALRCCAVQRISEEVAHNARGLLLEFADVSDIQLSQIEAEQITINRQHFRFEPLINLAKLILKSSSPGTGGARLPVYSLMFDMNVVFERFVAAEMQAALAGNEMTLIPQVGGRSLLKHNGKGRFNLRPDLGIVRNDRLVCLIDTKWKRLDLQKHNAGVKQADVYQTYAYGKEFDVPLTVLLYPRCGKLPELVANYHHNLEYSKECSQRMVSVKTVDIGEPMVLRSSRIKIWENLLRCIDLCN
jgi:5-methylcytosine-specific restriction enzyme subunit McrC